MKRKASGTTASATKKRQRPVEPDYCDAECVRDEYGGVIWPAPEVAIDKARAFLRACAEERNRVLLAPDKDADGLSSGVIVHRTLTALGLPKEMIDVHLLPKGTTIHDESERSAMLEKNPERIIVLDHGGRHGPPVVDNPSTKSLILDHHLSDEYPEASMVVSACHYPPVATTSLLTYEICKTMHPSIETSCAYLCAIGTHGDLGTSIKWKPPFPDMSEAFRTHSKKLINDTVSLINAPRRTATYDVISAWNALLNAESLKEIILNPRLQDARAEIAEETERKTHTPPKFTKDGKFAVLKIHSGAQVHPIIATRWAGFLAAKKLEVIMVANYGYLPEKVNFSCRIARSARSKDPPVNIIESLKAYAAQSDDNLTERMGNSFAQGHKEASGGIVPLEAFEELMATMKVGEKPDKDPAVAPAKKSKVIAPQQNNLRNYFAKISNGEG
jgi:DHH family